MPAKLSEQNFVHNDDRMMENTFSLLLLKELQRAPYEYWLHFKAHSGPDLSNWQVQWLYVSLLSLSIKMTHKFGILANLTDAGLQCDALILHK